LSEGRRIARLTDGHEARAQTFGKLKLSLGFGLGAEANVASSATPRQQRQGGDGSLGAAEFVDQGAEVAGPTFSLLINLSQARR
jgi:hypothetical protein